VFTNSKSRSDQKRKKKPPTEADGVGYVRKGKRRGEARASKRKLIVVSSVRGGNERGIVPKWTLQIISRKSKEMNILEGSLKRRKVGKRVLLVVFDEERA